MQLATMLCHCIARFLPMVVDASRYLRASALGAGTRLVQQAVCLVEQCRQYRSDVRSTKVSSHCCTGWLLPLDRRGKLQDFPLCCSGSLWHRHRLRPVGQQQSCLVLSARLQTQVDLWAARTGKHLHRRMSC